jgi:leader peptidase (prepilin peptidase)/N-methyltransferase
MSTSATLLGGAAIGMAVGALLVPFTRRELAASVARSADAESLAAAEYAAGTTATVTAAPPVPVAAWHRVALVVASGLVPAYVLHQVGWSVIALPPLVLLVGLIQLAYCDLTRRLLPRTLVYAVSAAVIVSGIVIAGVMHEWQRLTVASIGGGVFFALLFAMNLMNPRWIAFGDVRLSLVIGFGLAWVSPIALLEGFFLANLFAAVVGLSLIAAHRADRRSAVPFGLYLAVGTALVLLTWA